MDYTITERQRKFRERLYKAGFKEVRAWVKRKEGKKPGKITTTEFVKQIKKLSKGLDEGEKTRLFNMLIKITKGRSEEVKLKEKK